MRPGQPLSPDEDLDRAYREARNLIDAIAKQFEHTNPNAGLGELDDFLRAKAKEWAVLRGRIASLEADDLAIAELKETSLKALAEGRLRDVEEALSRAEALHQHDRTLIELRKLAELRISRGDVSLLRRDYSNAMKLYLSAAELFSAINEDEMVSLLEGIAEGIYENGRRSTEPYFTVAVPLLERAAATDTARDATVRLAQIQYQISLILRNAAEREKTSDRIPLLERAIGYCRSALNIPGMSDDIGKRSTICASLANCLGDLFELKKDQLLLEEGVDLLNNTVAELKEADDSTELLSYVYNALGTLLLKKVECLSKLDTSEVIDDAIDVFRESIYRSEIKRLLYPWVAAKVNLANLL
jgi:tetratricopeptide (TPR) repeat protein